MPGFGTRRRVVFKALCDHPLLGAYARLRYAEIALDSHHLKEAARVLGDLTPSGQSAAEAANGVLLKEHAYLVGRLRLAQRQPALAQQIFTAALPPPDERRQGLTARLLVDNYWGWARSCLDEDQPDRAQAALENLLEHEPPTEFLAPSFAWLESLCDRLPNPDVTDLQRWAADDEQRDREAYARLTLAHLEARAGRAERAEEILAAFGADFPSHPLRARALLDLAALRLNLGRTREARAALNRGTPPGREQRAMAHRDRNPRRPHLSRGERQRPGRRTLRGARRPSGHRNRRRRGRVQRRSGLVALGRRRTVRRRARGIQ